MTDFSVNPIFDSGNFYSLLIYKFCKHLESRLRPTFSANFLNINAKIRPNKNDRTDLGPNCLTLIVCLKDLKKKFKKKSADERKACQITQHPRSLKLFFYQ